MESISTIIALFVEGVASFFSPCILPLVPLYMAYLTKDAQRVDADGNITYARAKTMRLTFGFVLGISVVFILAGLGAGVIRNFFQQNQLIFSIIGGMLLLLMGLSTLHIIEIPFLEKTYQKQINTEGKMTFFKAWLMGFFFSFAWSPCIGPMLANAIIMASSVDALSGWIYIAAYAIGFMLMFIILGLFTTTILNFLKRNRHFTRYASIVGGAIVAVMGVYMLTTAFQRIHILEGINQTEQIASGISEGEGSESNSGTEDLPAIEQYGFTLKNAKGEDIKLVDYKGKTIILNFFGTWCGYCNQELPILQKIKETEENVEVLLIATPNVGSEGNIEYIEQYMSDKGYDMTILYDSSLQVTREFGISGYPTSFIIKPDGEFLGYVPGYIPEEGMRQAIEEARKV
ncbi:MAG: redoxin domain-containing protein [Solobacterium sp.]|nr:redoxin domain-containing protein [Solobacterium sp.]